MKKNIANTLAIMFMVGFATLLIACQPSSREQEQTTPALVLDNMDTSILATEDFFLHVNGQWMEKTSIPADKARWGSFLELREKSRLLLQDILEREQAAPAQKDPDQQKTLDFYRIGMDSALAEKNKFSPLLPYVEKINNAVSLEQLLDLLAEHHIVGAQTFFGNTVFADLGNSDINTLYLNAAGLGLPEKDYYFKTEEKFQKIREAYVQHIARMFEFLDYGDQDAMPVATGILTLETALAQSRLDPAERRDPYKLYNKRARSELQTTLPSVAWEAYLAKISCPQDLDTLVVMEPAFMKAVDNVLQVYPLQEIKNYFTWHLLLSNAPYLHKEIVDENFNFYQKTIRGLEKIQTRQERVIGRINAYLGEALGKMYVEEAFSPEAKENMTTLVDNLKEAFAARIEKLDWMSAETKEKALKKLSTFRVKIGYPDKWESYANLDIGTNSYVENVIAARAFHHYKDITDAGQPVDKDKWRMNPQTVNAYYSPTNNEIVFPSAILQPPFYNYHADDAINYGGIGAVIGHEITHGFDDQGSQFDENGDLKNWWTEEDREKFDARAQRLIDQYNAYEPIEGSFVNGKLTLGENIADLGGVATAYDALLLSYEKDKSRPDPIDGYTPEQRFFLSWATIWRLKARDEYVRNQVITDPHSPAPYRANGPLSNFDPFYESFDVQEGQALWRPDSVRAVIW